MTVESTTTKSTHPGNDVATVFPVGFVYGANNEVKVKLTNAEAVTTDLVEDTDYSLSGDGAAGDGELNYPLEGAPLPTGHKLTVYCETPITQARSWPTTGEIDTQEIEKADDKLTRICQQLKEGLERCVKVDVDDDTDPAELLSELQEDAAEAVAAMSTAQSARDVALAARDVALAAAAGVDLPALGGADEFLTINGAGDGLEYSGGADARAKLGLGSAALADTGTGEGDVPVLGAGGELDVGVIPVSDDIQAVIDTMVVMAWKVAQLEGESQLGMVNTALDVFSSSDGVVTSTNALYDSEDYAWTNKTTSALPDGLDSWDGETSYVSASGVSVVATADSHTVYHKTHICGDFSIEWTCSSSERVFGIGVASVETAFVAGDGHNTLMASGADSFWYDGLYGNLYHDDSSVASPASATGIPYKLTREGGTIKFYRDDVLAHTFTQTFSGDMYFLVGWAQSGYATVTVSEFEFGHNGGDMLLESTSFSATSAPSSLRCLVEVASDGAWTPDVDLIVSAGRDGGTTFSAGTLEKVGGTATLGVYATTIDVSGQPTGTAPRIRVASANGEVFSIHKWAIQSDVALTV